MSYQIDDTDMRILEILDQDGRLAMRDLASRIGMSAPAIATRVRQLEAEGVIRHFSVDLNPRALGYILEAIVRIRPRPGQLHIVQRMIVDEPRFTACDKVTGDDCFIARLCLKSINELDPLLDPLHDKAETSTAIIKSSPIMRRSPPLT